MRVLARDIVNNQLPVNLLMKCRIIRLFIPNNNRRDCFQPRILILICKVMPKPNNPLRIGTSNKHSPETHGMT